MIKMTKNKLQMNEIQIELTHPDHEEVLLVILGDNPERVMSMIKLNAHL